MKKFILLTAAFLLFSFAYSQEKKEIYFGIKGGLNLCSITNADEDGVNSSTLVGFHVGVLGEFMLGDNFAIQPELLYSTQGVKLDFEGDKGDLKMDYVTIPLMAKYYVVDAFSIELGPQIGFLTAAKATSGGESIDVKDSMKTTDFGLNFGVGYNITENFNMGLRYNLGLTQIQKDLVAGESASKNSVFQIALGYRF
jgi:opacity protein-like surface antigen